MKNFDRAQENYDNQEALEYWSDTADEKALEVRVYGDGECPPEYRTEIERQVSKTLKKLRGHK